MMELLSYRFFVYALGAALLVSFSCALIGSYIVSRRMVFVSGGITHASFGGIGLGYFLGIPPLVGATLFAIVSAVGFDLLARRSKIRLDSMIGILWSMGMAIGIVLIYLTPGYAPNLTSYLFGNILAVSPSDLILMLVLAALNGLFFIFFHQSILYLAFDEEFLRAMKIRTDWLNALLMALIALTIVITIRMVGIILVISMLTIPQATASLIIHDFKAMILYSLVFGIAASISGLFLSFYLNIPSGATIIFCSGLLFGLVKLIQSIIDHYHTVQRLSGRSG